jgi:uncharacterized protein
MISQALIDLVRQGFALRLDGIHGEAHWARVCANGLRLAEQTGADLEIIELFAYLHDAKRLSNGWDKKHGQRAAEFIGALPRSLLDLPDRKRKLLCYAVAHHSEGLTEADAPPVEAVTVQTCWDADRLDLGRINIRPAPRYLCTGAAQDPAMIEWAFHRSQAVIYQVE